MRGLPTQTRRFLLAAAVGAMTPVPIRPSLPCGRQPASTWPGSRAPGALNAAGAMGTYTISDRGGSLRNKGDLVVAVEGDRRPFNQHGVMRVTSAKHPNVKTGPGQQFIDRLIFPPRGNGRSRGTRPTGSSCFTQMPTTRRRAIARLPWITIRSIQLRTLRRVETAGLLA
jgi:hypothetical protein